MRILITLVLCLYLLMPIAVQAQTTMRNPLSYSLAEYGLMLGVAIAGGVVAWIRKVRAGEYPAWSLGQLVGEMCISAFAGLLTFWGCEWMQVPQILTASMAGIAGLASSKFLSIAEAAAQRVVEKRLGVRP
jgi:uncharacterized membrane protein